MIARYAVICAVLAPAALWMSAAAGCAARNPWTFNAPPTRVEPAPPIRTERKTVIVVGEFSDPTGAPPYAGGVGRFMSQALSRALLNDGRDDVWINPQLSRAVEDIVNQGVAGTRLPEPGAAELSANRGQRLADNGMPAADNRVHFVILGKVTDFQYTGDLPRHVSRWGVFGPRNEAIVAIDLRIVDMRTRRVVGADHIRATVPAGRTDAGELHGAVPFDSYLFWSTPLGRAGKQAIESAVARMDDVVPPPLIDPQIEKMIAWRRVSIVGGSMAGVSEGQEFYVLLPPWSGGTSGGMSATRAGDESGGGGGWWGWRPVRDAHTGHPLMVRIDTVSRTHSTGWLLGERPLEISLRGALLLTKLPAPPEHEPYHADPEQGPLANMPAAVGGGG